MHSYLKSYQLFCPGPVNVHPEVERASVEFALCHREEEFSELLDHTRALALEVAGIKDVTSFSAVVVTGSGTAGNEAVLSSAVPRDGRVLVLANGEFGERLAHISAVYHPNTVTQRHEWGAPIDLARLEETLSEHRFDLVVMVHHETSTGFLNPAAEVGALCHRHQTRFFVDAVSSYSADLLDLEAAHVSYMTTSSGKAIGAYPGLALVIARRDAVDELKSYPVRNHYLNLARHFSFAEERSQTPNTPALPLILAFNRALELARDEGVEGRHARLDQLAEYVRAHLLSRGFELDQPRGPRSVVLTNVKLPSIISFEELRQSLRARGFVIYGGKGPLADQVFQISTISHVGLEEIDRFFESLDEVMKSYMISLEAL